MTKLNVAEAKKHFSNLLGRVSEEGETILITRKGRTIAKIVPASAKDEPSHLVNVQGWLEDDDPFFTAVDEIVEARLDHPPRSIRGHGLVLRDEETS